MFLLQLLRMAKMQDLLKSSLLYLRQNGILEEGRHELNIDMSLQGKSGKRAQTTVHVTYSLANSAKAPQILSFEAEDWKMAE